MAEVMKVYANFHTHTTHSDGVYSPTEIVDVAVKEGYRALSITDHDTYTGNAEARDACQRAGIDFIPGIEFSTRSKAMRQWFHMTAFDFDPEYPEMKEYLRRCSATLADQTEQLFERGKKNGFISEKITWQDVLDYNKSITWLCNNHVFQTMKHMGIATDADYPAFFENVFHHHRREIPKLYEFLPIEEIIPLVKAAGGITIVAHPYKQIHNIPKLLEYGIEGIEVWHSTLTDEEKREALKLALKHNLYISGGSDHEGLCGGQYKYYEHPEEMHFWAEPCSLGTTKEFFDEIKNQKLMPNREEYIMKYIEEYK